MKNITKEQENFLNKCTRGTWKLNTESGLVDIDGDFNCYNKGLSDFLGIEFGNISGSFDCSHNKLVSLYGSPKYVGENFYCSNNNLVSLKGAPKKVGKSFYCYDNQLVSLEGAPQEIGGDFDCSHNKLISLEGAPDEVGGFFLCHNNQLVSLKGAPKKFKGSFYCDPTSLRDCPIDLLGKIYFFNNKKYFVLKDYITMIINGLDPEIYLKKMI